MISMTTLSDALKTFYLPSIVEQMNYKVNAFLANIQQNGEEVSGGSIKMAVKYGKNGGLKAALETDDLPTTGSRKITQVTYPTKNIFGKVDITDKMLKVADGNDTGSFVNALQMLLDDLMADAKDQFGRMLYGDGTGKLATCSAEGPVTTLSLDSVQYLCEGMYIDILDVLNVVATAGREILNVDTVAKTITISGAPVITVATDYITVSGAYNKELTGLDAIFQSTGLLYGIDRGTNKWFTPNFKAVNGEITELAIQEAIDMAEIRAGASINYLLCSYGVSRAYQLLMNTQKRNIDVMELKGGYKTLSYNGIALDKDRYAPVRTMFAMDLADFKLHKIGDWSWLDKDGAILNRVSNKAAYEAALVCYCDLGNRKPSGQTKLSGITEH